jgi:VWFA-related protein
LRRILIFGLLALVAIPSEAAKRLTVAQLEKMLAADLAAQKQDSEVASQLAGISLAERIPRTTFARLIAQFRSSSQTAVALTIIANQSEFLELPATELVGDAAPDNPGQARMLQSARQYVAQTLRGLPNFLATRTINLYDDRPQSQKPGDWPTRSGLHLVGTSRAEISVTRERDDQPPTQSSAVWESKFGLVSGGEFGTTLGMILAETEAGNVSWSHWERGSAGVLAVFRYSVPASASHFEVISSFQQEASVAGERSTANGRGVAGIEVRPNVSSNNLEVVRTRPAYHGSIWLDPADGSVYRVTMEADMDKALPFRRAAILVEYGPVEIAGARFTCPLRSLAVSETQATAETRSGNAVTMWLNETLFSDYHRFGSASRMVNETAGTQQAPDSAAPPTAPSTASNAVPGPSPAVDQRKPPAAGTSLTPPASSEAPRADARETGTPAAPPPPTPTMADETGFALRIDVSSLLIPAVVLDKNGRSVGDLGKEDFVVLDDGKPRPITGFTLVKRPQDAGSRPSESQTPAPGTAPPAAPQSAPQRRRFLIFLFDDRHMTPDELPPVKKAASQLLAQPLPDSDYAGVLSLMGVNSGITRDRAVLQAAVAKLSLHQALQHDRGDCPDVDYYSADQIIHQHNAMEFQIAVDKAKQCSMIQAELSPEDPFTGLNNPNDPFQRAAMSAATRALAMGEEDARESLAPFRTVVSAMSKLPGERVLIFVSTGFLSLSPETMRLKSDIMDLAARSDVIVNAMDARGLYVGNIDASQGGSTSTIGLVTGQLGQNRLASMQASENAMSELAVGTGGRFFHNNNDLLGGLESLAAIPENLYLLEVSLKDVKANGAFHRLQLKLDKPGLEVLARKGYVAPKEAAAKNGKASD